MTETNPITLLFRSRAFWLAVGALIINAIIAAFPALEPLKGQFDDIMNTLVALLIAKMGLEDVAQKLGDAKVEAAALNASAPKATTVNTGSGDVNVASQNTPTDTPLHG